MGSHIETNDTLQITSAEGFPPELDANKHFEKPFTAEDFKGHVFQFQNKPDVRVYHQPPVRNFLVHNIDGKWLYWGLILMKSVTHDMVNKTTSGEFELLYIYTPDEMKSANRMMGGDKSIKTSYFS